MGREADVSMSDLSFLVVYPIALNTAKKRIVTL